MNILVQNFPAVGIKLLSFKAQPDDAWGKALPRHIIEACLSIFWYHITCSCLYFKIFSPKLMSRQYIMLFATDRRYLRKSKENSIPSTYFVNS